MLRKGGIWRSVYHGTINSAGFAFPGDVSLTLNMTTVFAREHRDRGNPEDRSTGDNKRVIPGRSRRMLRKGGCPQAINKKI